MILAGPSVAERRALAALLVLAVAVQVAFVRATSWTLEDAMILARVARTFAETGVLAFHPSAAISTATSPPFALLVGFAARAGVEPLLAARVLGGLASLGVGVVLFAVARRIVGPGAWFAPACYWLLPTTLAYATCGLETSLYALAVIAALAAAHGRHHGVAAACATAAVLLRLDGLIVLAMIGGVRLLDLVSAERQVEHATDSWRRVWRDGLVTGLALAAAAGLHHLAYGAWVPWSVVAKGMAYTVEPWPNLLGYLERMLWSQKAGLPFYVLAVVGVVLAWGRDRRSMLFVAWYAVYHLAFGLRAPLFSWYLQPPIPVLALFAGIGIAGTIDVLGSRLWVGPSTLRRVAAPLFVVAALLAGVRYADGRAADARYEHSVRLAAGEWLAEHAPADALVFTESLGHIGYPNHLRFVDWPGLVSREVPELVDGMSQIDGYRRILEHFEADLLVLRDTEVEDLGDTLASYAEVARFDSPERGPGYRILQRERDPVSSGDSHDRHPEAP